MVALVTDDADRLGVPCYLESSKNRPNMGIYERWGFEFVQQMKCDDDGAVCKLYCMVRQPRQS